MSTGRNRTAAARAQRRNFGEERKFNKTVATMRLLAHFERTYYAKSSYLFTNGPGTGER